MRIPSRMPAAPLLGLLAALFALGCGATPPTAPDAEPDETQIPLMGMAVAGQFAGAGGHRAVGGVTLTIDGDRAQIEFASDFVIDGVPGPFVYLNTTNNPNTGTPLRVAPLTTNRGSQVYTFRVPPGVQYTWILVWCDPFNVGVGEARINAG